MRKVERISGSDNHSHIHGQGSTVEADSGWETENTFACRKEIYKINEDLINIANKKIPLENVFNSYKIYFENVYSPSGWNQRRRCPLPDHNDNTPSFNYNKAENRFYCFGCKRGGQAVQFVSLMEELSYIAAAEKLLDRFNSLEDAVLDLQDQRNDEIDQALLEFAEDIRRFVSNNNTDEAREFMESVTWGLDLYLHKHVPRSSLDADNLKARIELLSKRLEDYAQ